MTQPLTCPACGGSFPGRTPLPGVVTYCPHCRAALPAAVDAPSPPPTEPVPVPPPRIPMPFPLAPAAAEVDRPTPWPGPEAEPVPPPPDPVAWFRVDRGLFWVRFGVLCLGLVPVLGFARAVLDARGPLADRAGLLGVRGVSAGAEFDLLAVGVPVAAGGLAVAIGRRAAGNAVPSVAARPLLRLSAAAAGVGAGGLFVALAVGPGAAGLATAAVVALAVGEVWFLLAAAVLLPELPGSARRTVHDFAVAAGAFAAAAAVWRAGAGGGGIDPRAAAAGFAVLGLGAVVAYADFVRGLRRAAADAMARAFRPHPT